MANLKRYYYSSLQADNPRYYGIQVQLPHSTWREYNRIRQ